MCGGLALVWRKFLSFDKPGQRSLQCVKFCEFRSFKASSSAMQPFKQTPTHFSFERPDQGPISQDPCLKLFKPAPSFKIFGSSLISSTSSRRLDRRHHPNPRFLGPSGVQRTSSGPLANIKHCSRTEFEFGCAGVAAVACGLARLVLAEHQTIPLHFSRAEWVVAREQAILLKPTRPMPTDAHPPYAKKKNDFLPPPGFKKAPEYSNVWLIL
ncbi:hypothetical protein DFH08DRAFT_809923 [Mycena albidolilacea]|uniref:Uncharacterized protein n=1 Tax=Mycena albidolilacea TaxID=1033008 RepID=A0AAD6ZYK7_9AGAR|nr:hypothetical protein DFH08DRAFT_809923 [Mycena albidolilacea]